jgi:hypothetical protein
LSRSVAPSAAKGAHCRACVGASIIPHQAPGHPTRSGDPPRYYIQYFTHSGRTQRPQEAHPSLESTARTTPAAHPLPEAALNPSCRLSHKETNSSRVTNRCYRTSPRLVCCPPLRKAASRSTNCSSQFLSKPPTSALCASCALIVLSARPVREPQPRAIEHVRLTDLPGTAFPVVPPFFSASVDTQSLGIPCLHTPQGSIRKQRCWAEHTSTTARHNDCVRTNSPVRLGTQGLRAISSHRSDSTWLA